MTKAELRNKYKALRASLPESQIEIYSLAIANQALALPIWELSYYHIYLSIQERNEVNTDHILSILAGKDKNVVISKSDFKTTTMAHYLLTDATVIKKSDFNIPEPVEGIEISTAKIELVFVPLLAFDKMGNRVGYGKGFYDAFLNECQPGTIKIGLSFFEAEDAITDIGKHDVRLDYCLTPNRIYTFSP